MLKAIIDATNLSKDPEAFFKEKQRSFGSSFPVYLPGAPRTIFTGTPEGTKELFSIPPNVFSSPKDNPIEPIVGQNSLILLGGDKHKEVKKSLNPLFFGAVLTEYTPIIKNIVQEELSLINEKSIGALSFSQEITLQIIISLVYGVEERSDRLKLKEIIQRYIDSYHPSLMFFPILRHPMNPIWNNFKKNETIFENELKKILAQKENNKSILSKLNSIHEEDTSSILDQLKTMLIAGHETTAISLFWCLYYVLQNNELKDLLRDTSKSISLDIFINEPLIESVCFESMRIHSPVPIILRSLNEDLEFLGHQMKKGDNIGAALTQLHSNEELFVNPDLFIGDRFLHKKLKGFEFAPFGGGTRKCIGSQLALLELKIILYHFFRKGDWILYQSKKPKPIIKGITMGPDRDVFLKLKS